MIIDVFINIFTFSLDPLEVYEVYQTGETVGHALMNAAEIAQITHQLNRFIIINLFIQCASNWIEQSRKSFGSRRNWTDPVNRLPK